MLTALGIDVAERRKGLDLVILDADREVVFNVNHATVDAVARVTATFQPDVVCIDSPPAWSNYGRSRAAERELRSLGITAFSTPTDPGQHAFYSWMRVGFSIFEAIEDSHPRYRSGAIRGTAAEVFPEATAVLLRGHLRPTSESKSSFRRAVLADNGIEHAKLGSVDAVDAALAALTGLLALEGQVATVGDPDEGVILLPCSELPRYPLVRPSGASALSQPTRRVRPVASSAEQSCLCGCGAPVRRRFLPGHDAKLKSRLRRLHEVGDGDATAQLVQLGWLD